MKLSYEKQFLIAFGMSLLIVGIIVLVSSLRTTSEKRAKQSVVGLSCQNTITNLTTSGSAFFVSENLLMTAADLLYPDHSGQTSNETEKTPLAIRIWNDEWVRGDIHVVSVDMIANVAILKMPEVEEDGYSHKHLDIASGKQRGVKKAFLVGDPIHVLLNGSVTNPQRRDPRRLEDGGSPLSVLLTDINVERGMRYIGSPIVSKNSGKVLGIYTDKFADGTAGGVTFDFLHKFLEEYKNTPTERDGSGTDVTSPKKHVRPIMEGVSFKKSFIIGEKSDQKDGYYYTNPENPSEHFLITEVDGETTGEYYRTPHDIVWFKDSGAVDILFANGESKIVILKR